MRSFHFVDVNVNNSSIPGHYNVMPFIKDLQRKVLLFVYALLWRTILKRKIINIVTRYCIYIIMGVFVFAD